MIQTQRYAVSLVVAAVLGGGAYGQVREKNPFTRDSDAVEAGQALYLDKCAVCHGQDATGGMAANLRHSRSVGRGSDAALFEIIRKGFPGSAMPPQPDMDERHVWQIVAFLHSVSRPGLEPPLSGDVKAGRTVFENAGCANCHQVDGSGGFLGPSLNSIAARKASDEIRSDVVDPSADLAVGFELVSAKTRDGKTVEGVLKNEDLFSVQILTRDGKHHTLQRRDISELGKLSRSAMPANYGKKLSDDQLQNLLAYLDRQRDPYVATPRGWANY